jgi:hypothetical protein
MRRFRVVIASFVAAAMLSTGAAACTPEQSSLIGTGLVNLITFILFVHVYGDPVGSGPGGTIPTTTAPPSSTVPSDTTVPGAPG